MTHSLRTKEHHPGTHADKIAVSLILDLIFRHSHRGTHACLRHFDIIDPASILHAIVSCSLASFNLYSEHQLKLS